MKLSIVILSTLLLLNLGCLPIDREHGIKVCNNTNQKIVFFANYVLPDTLLPAQEPILTTIEPFNSTWFFGSSINDSELKNLQLHDLSFFFLSKDTVDKYPWSVIKSNNKILKRYDFKHTEFLNGEEVTYP